MTDAEPNPSVSERDSRDAPVADEVSDTATSEETRRAPQSMDPEVRRAVMDACALRTMPDGWRANFAISMVTSVVVAVMGLTTDSAALVIGAMLIAPLMTPVLGTAASLVMSLTNALRRSLVILALATGGAIALSALLGRVLGAESFGPEILSRTSPDVRDLIVALAAGVAGAYAMTRPDLSAALPGVAIAVALVPPLGVVGLTLEAGRTELARGAALLYATNLAAIVLSGMAVFVATGFAPARRLEARRAHVVGSALVISALVIAVAVPLTIASLQSIRDNRDREEVRRAVDAWLAGNSDVLEEIAVTEASVQIGLRGPFEPPPTASLVSEVERILGPSTAVEVEWTPTQAARLTDDDPFDAQIREAVQRWLGDGDFITTSVIATPDRVRIDISSVTPPPTVAALRTEIGTTVGRVPPVEVNWIPLTRIQDQVDDSPTVEDRLRAAVDAWLPDGSTTVVADVRIGTDDASVDLIGETPPVRLERLLADFRAILGPDVDVAVYFTERRRLVTTTTTTPPPPVSEVPERNDP